MNYCYETIEECKKVIIDKAINLDIAHATSVNLFECFVRTVRTAAIWIIIYNTIVTFATEGFRLGVRELGFSILAYIAGALLMSWVKFNHNNGYEKMKIALFENMVSECKEFQEGEYADWQRQQILKNMATVANINLDYNNAK